MFSVNFAEIEQYQHLGRWDLATQIMVDAAKRLESGGADFILIVSNTMHLLADEIEQNVSIPLLHIADPTGEAVQQQEITRIGLIGTAFTMEGDFYKKRLQDRFGFDVIVPDADDRAIVHSIIYQELVTGRTSDSSRQEYKRIIEQLAQNGAQCVILGCTEIKLLIKQEDTQTPLFDTTTLHALAAVDRAITAT
jgi:aspartate racemase